ncbi:MAG: hypothetical protein R3A47_01630 [Polyangiales bacterium]
MASIEQQLVFTNDDESWRILDVDSLFSSIRTMEASRASMGLRPWIREKIQQNRDFFRHGFSLPFYWMRRRTFRRRVPSQVFCHPELRETFFAIEQVGPIVDNFLFKGRVPIADLRTHIADVAFLYMQIADEFVDCLLQSGGEVRVRSLVARFFDADRDEIPLERVCSGDLLELGFEPASGSEKYGFRFDELIDLLSALREVLRKQTPVQTELNAFFVHCFGTYLEELRLFDETPSPDRLDPCVTATLFRSKTVDVMRRWLCLRAQLLGLDPTDYKIDIERWGYLLATFQIFDDLKDVGLDAGKQPNLALQLANWFYPNEYDAIVERVAKPPRPVDRDDVLFIDLHAPRTVMLCIAISRATAFRWFDPVLRYAWDQRWQKSWMQRAEFVE